MLPNIDSSQDSNLQGVPGDFASCLFWKLISPFYLSFIVFKVFVANSLNFDRIFI